MIDNRQEEGEEVEETREPVQKNQFDLDAIEIDSTEIDLTHTRADHIPDLSRFEKVEVIFMISTTNLRMQ
uniref:Uncharacterized protein n=1 Tax=Caenorhabditis japonica TaxID=281687 RepID=A0A8R1E2E8_CAEJA